MPNPIVSLNEKTCEAAEARQHRPLERTYPFTCADGIYFKRSRDGSYENAAAIVPIGVQVYKYREVIGSAAGPTESSECCREFLPRFGSHGLRVIHMGSYATDV